jgi:hypothetical protein
MVAFVSEIVQQVSYNDGSDNDADSDIKRPSKQPKAPSAALIDGMRVLWDSDSNDEVILFGPFMY